MTQKPVLVVVGLDKEEKIAAGPNVVTVVSASDPVLLKKLLDQLKGSDYRAVVSFGIGGGLDPTLNPGDLILAKETIAAGGPYNALTNITGKWTTDPNLLATVDAKLRAGGLNPRIGIETCDDDLVVVNDAATKAQLRLVTGADQVDMESHVAAAFAAANKLPFIAIRAVSDPASRGVPPAAALPLTSTGGPNIWAILGSVVTNPGQIPLLVYAYFDSTAALSTLESVRKLLDLGGL